MPKFVPKRHEQILAKMIAKVIARTNLSDVADSSYVKHILAAAARQDDEQYYQMTLLLQLFSIDKATGDDLDARAKDIQPATIIRIPAAKATGEVVFSRAGTTGTINIPIGTRVKTAGGEVFTTTEAGTITAASPEQVSGHGVGRDSNLVSVIAVTPGSAGNVIANTVIKFDGKPAGVDEVTNLSAFANGLDKETDDSFRNRIKDFIASLPRSTVSAIEAGVIGQQDPVTSGTVLFAKVFEDTVNRGEITVFIDDGTGSAESFTTVTGENLTLGIGAFPYQKAIIPIPAADILDGETFTIDDGVNPPTIFEFDTVPDGVTGGNVLVDISGDTTAADVAVTINAAINGVGATLEVSATGSQVITVTHDDAPSGTVDITNTVADPDFFTGQITAAVGGETRLFSDNKPIRDASPHTLTSSTRGVLTRDVDYTLNPASGQFDFTPALVNGEVLTLDYVYFTGLIQFVQKIVDGDPDDRDNFPGLRAGGVRATVLTPQVLLQNVNVTVTVIDGFDQDEVKLNVRQAIKTYINGLSISGDLIRNRLIQRMMAVSGVTNVAVTTPAADVILLDDQLARTQDANIVVS